MLFFWWKKYDGDWLATGVSMFGTIILTLGSIGLVVALLSLLGESTIFVILSVVVGIAVFLALKFLLNKLTDKIDKKYDALSYNVGKQMDDRKKSKQMAVINEGSDQQKIFAIIKKEVLDKDIVIAGIRKLTDQSLIESTIRYYVESFPNYTKDSHINRIIIEAAKQLQDENKRSYYLKKFQV